MPGLSYVNNVVDLNPISNNLSTKIMTNEEKVWYFLVEKIGNKYGAAAVMGNLAGEGGPAFNPMVCEGGKGVNSESYTNSINSTAPNSKSTFMSDSYFGYGIAQWTSSGRRGNLYQYILDNIQPFNIGSLEGQLGFLIQELQSSYPSVWARVVNATDIETPTVAVLAEYEIPGAFVKGSKYYSKENQKAAIDKRTGYADKYFAKYSNSSGTYSASTSVPAADALLSAAISQLGKNGRTFIDWWYDKAKWGDPPEYDHWCMMFVQWCMQKCGISSPYETAQCQAFYNNTGSLHVDNSSVQRGDIILFHWSSVTRNYWSHVGFVESVSGNSITTIEGNSGNSPGMVKRNTYNRDKYGTPNSGTSQEMAFVRLTGVGNYFGSSADAFTSQIADTIDTRTFNEIYASIKDFQYEEKAVELNYELQREQVTEDITVHAIETIDADANAIRTHSTSLLTTPTYVESPFIMLKVGNYTFGSYSATGSFEFRNSSNKVTYPNYMTNIQITKVNGTVNRYVLTMTYQIEAGQDPNLLDKIFGSVGYGTVYISYGDWNAPSFIYREEEAIITKLVSQIDFSQSRIIYTMYCTSNALALIGGYYNFEGQTAKPSDIIYDMVYSQEGMYHLQEMFPGLKSKTNFSRFVAQDDASVELLPKSGIDALSYINYLVSCMSPTTSDPASPIRDGNYYLTICDDISGEFGGTYFKVTKVDTSTGAISINNSDVYEVDIGYPGDTLVTSFKINEDNSWALLYNYSQEVSSNDYVYNIDAQGNVYSSYSPNITTSSSSYKTTETQRNWWTQMTQFPITATLEIKGLLRPAMLMSYVRINALFYGLRHVSSGLYIITKQVDTVDSRGYRTTLSLQRIAGDLDTITTQTKTITKTITKKVYK